VRPVLENNKHKPSKKKPEQRFRLKWSLTSFEISASGSVAVMAALIFAFMAVKQRGMLTPDRRPKLTPWMGMA
jgi:hypothetical protein